MPLRYMLPMCYAISLPILIIVVVETSTFTIMILDGLYFKVYNHKKILNYVTKK